MNKKFIAPEIQVIKFSEADILTTSGGEKQESNKQARTEDMEL